MNLKQIVNSQSVKKLSVCYGRFISPYASNRYRDISTVSVSVLPSSKFDCSQLHGNHHGTKPKFLFSRYLHAAASQPELQPQLSSSAAKLDSDGSGDDDDGATNEFLSRFAWIMRKKLSEAYPECDKPTVDGMLLVIVEKVAYEMEKGSLDQMLGSDISSEEFSEDLWRTVWEVSNAVVEDMEKERKKEKMKQFLQDEEVKEMCRFAGEIGLQGDMLRELRFKWAREKMEEADFYEGLERLREEERAQETVGAEGETVTGEEALVTEEEAAVGKVVDLPKRHGKIKYKIYGLDLSDSKWGEVADKVHEAGEAIWPQEAKPISGKCKLVAEKILSLKLEDDPSSLLAEYKELQEPKKIDWIALLDQLKQRDSNLHLKVAEHLLSETSFHANIRDYSNLLAAHAEETHVEDAERILQKMNDNGILPDISTAKTLALMYSKAGDLEKANQAFETYKSHGLTPDVKVCNSMIMAYVKAGHPSRGESLLREMETTNMKVPEEIHMALLASYSQQGDAVAAGRMSDTMHLVARIKPTLETCTLVIEACARARDLKKARDTFNHLMRLGLKPDDRCTSSMIAAYETNNLLDQALELLLELERDVGFEPGVATYTVLIDWLGKMGLIDEVEQLLGKIANLGEAPPLKIQAILCDMYARAKMEKKALQALGVLEAKKEQLGADDFERVINGLLVGEFNEEAKRMGAMMVSQGHSQSEALGVSLALKAAFKHSKTRQT